MKKNLLLYILIAVVAIMVLNVMFFPALFSDEEKEVDVTYDVFLSQLEAGEIEDVQIEDDYIYYTCPAEENIIYNTVRMQDDNLVDRLYNSGVTFGQVAVS